MKVFLALVFNSDHHLLASATGWKLVDKGLGLSTAQLILWATPKQVQHWAETLQHKGLGISSAPSIALNTSQDFALPLSPPHPLSHWA